RFLANFFTSLSMDTSSCTTSTGKPFKLSRANSLSSGLTPQSTTPKPSSIRRFATPSPIPALPVTTAFFSHLSQELIELTFPFDTHHSVLDLTVDDNGYDEN